MRIVVNAVSARAGGGLTYLREMTPLLADELKRRGAEIHLLVSEDVAMAIAPMLTGRDVVVHSPPWARLPGMARLLSEQTRLPHLLRSLSPAAVFHVGDIISPFGDAPNVVLCRNMLLYSPMGKNSVRLRALRQMARLSLGRASAVVFVSRTLADEVSSRFSVPRSEVIHHGPGLAVPFKERSGPLDTKLVVVGSIYDYKRIELAIGTVAELRQQGLPATLDVIGRPVERRYAQGLRDQVHRLGMQSAVRFVGEAGAADVAKAYGEATVAVVTSANESFCHPILEAFAGGLPVVVGNDLRVASEIGGEAAVFADPDPRHFADVVAALVADPVLYQRHVVAGRARNKLFAWAKTAEQTASLIASLN